MRVWLGVLLVGCSSVAPFPPSDDIAEFPDVRPDTTLPPFEASTFDVVDPDATTFNGGGPFTCVDCTCDGTLSYCLEISAGKAPIVDAGADDADAGAGICDPEASACTRIPVECLPKPTCDCVMKQYNAPCTCDVDPSGNGLVISCVYP